MKLKVAQSCPTLCDPVGYTVHGNLQARILEWVDFPSPGGLPNPGIEPRSPALQADSLPAESPGKPKNTGVGSLSLLQIFPTQESNRCLLHCRWILYQLSCQGSQFKAEVIFFSPSELEGKHWLFLYLKSANLWTGTVHWLSGTSNLLTHLADLGTCQTPQSYESTLYNPNKLWKILKEMGILDHLTCLLQNLYAGQEETVTSEHGWMDWFKIGKGVHQGCIFSPCSFNLYTEYVMRNSGLDEAQAGVKIVRRSINNLRYADNITLMAESKEELKNLLMKVKEESEKAGLKFNIQKAKIMASSPISSFQFSSVQFSHSVVSDSLWPHELQHARPPCPTPASRAHPNSCPLNWRCHPTISSSVIPFFSCPQSFPASGSFQMSQLFTSGGQSIGLSASTSDLPMNTQDWSPLGWTGWIS